MKTKQQLLIITIMFAFVLACQSVGQPPTDNAVSPTQTQEVVVELTETQEPYNLSPNENLDGHGVAMVLVPEGEFTMGGLASDAEAECKNKQDPGTCKRDPFLDEEPPHIVYLDNYHIDRYEITNELYQNCVNSGVCEPPIEVSSETHSDYYGNPEFNNYPVIYVDWNMANTYCEWRDARLPTEAEWEKAARGTDERIYPWGNTFDGLGNFCEKSCLYPAYNNQAYDDGYFDVAPVDSYADGISPYGVYNMAGNVWEWVADRYSDTYYQISPEINPKGPDTGDNHVLRGGAWYSPKHVLRALNRVESSEGGNGVGFRCAKDANP